MKLSIPTIALLLAAAVGAQKTTTLPPGFLTMESSDYGYYLGAYENGRHQVGMAGMPSAAVVSQIDFRRDGNSYSSSAVARKWSKVDVNMAETTAGSMSSTFATNIKTTPVNVLSAAVSWPAANTSPGGGPKTWGTSCWSVGFTKVFLFTGKQDLLTDCTFSSGVLGNGGTWGTSTKLWVMDAVTARTSVGGSAGFTGLKSCNDSNASSTAYAGYAVPFQWSYAKTTGNTTTANKYAIRFTISNSAKSTAHVMAASLKGKLSNTPGTGGALPIDLGWCNLLMVDLSGFVLYNYPTTSTSGYWNSATGYVPYPTVAALGLVGQNVYTQAGYLDSKTGALKLTAGGRSVINKQPADVTWKGRHIYRNNLTSTTGSSSTFGVPLQKVTYK